MFYRFSDTVLRSRKKSTETIDYFYRSFVVIWVSWAGKVMLSPTQPFCVLGLNFIQTILFLYDETSATQIQQQPFFQHHRTEKIENHVENVSARGSKDKASFYVSNSYWTLLVTLQKNFFLRKWIHNYKFWKVRSAWKSTQLLLNTAIQYFENRCILVKLMLEIFAICRKQRKSFPQHCAWPKKAFSLR